MLIDDLTGAFMTNRFRIAVASIGVSVLLLVLAIALLGRTRHVEGISFSVDVPGESKKKVLSGAYERDWTLLGSRTNYSVAYDDRTPTPACVRFVEQSLQGYELPALTDAQRREFMLSGTLAITNRLASPDERRAVYYALAACVVFSCLYTLRVYIRRDE